jgi:hypothetical protein
MSETWKARAQRAERQLRDEHRHHHPLPNYYPGCSACEEDRRRQGAP